FSASLHQQQRSEIMSQLLVVVNSFFRFFRSPLSRRTSSRTASNKAFQPSRHIRFAAFAARCLLRERDISEVQRSAQALCENNFTAGKKARSLGAGCQVPWDRKLMEETRSLYRRASRGANNEIEYPS
ncbi:hypothetical protein, partial [Pandoraea terrae]|uniref:hypothetical protein n=1 Tax=Pandoraea terrae TaxID=1537710 RepID=UPI001CD1EE58